MASAYNAPAWAATSATDDGVVLAACCASPSIFGAGSVPVVVIDHPPRPSAAAGTESPNTPNTVLNLTKMFTPIPVVLPRSDTSLTSRTSTAGKSIEAPGEVKTALSAIDTI